ncbi:HEPACAM family member 2-like isoform X2 [Heptranchias perlo]|uniref:HEPACAM family member 2-like isoform X2 n=1 Tax=Heptranchias perlo TaxID=212740 RepID=UPI00355AC461
MKLLLIAAMLQILQTFTGKGTVLADTQQNVMNGIIDQTVLLPLKHNISRPSEVFNLEWRVIRKAPSSILTFSPSSSFPYISEAFKKRVNFSKSNAELSLKNIQMTDEGTYELEVTTSDGKSTKCSIFLTVNHPVSIPQIEIVPEAPQTGNNVTLHCSALEGNIIHYNWYRCDMPLSHGVNYHLSQNNSSLTVLNVQQSDVGTYRCNVTNRISNKHKDFVLQLCSPSRPNPAGYGYIGYGGYPGYLGYTIIIVLCYRWKKQALKASKESDAIYENSQVSKKQSLTNPAETRIMCNMRKNDRRGR